MSTSTSTSTAADTRRRRRGNAGLDATAQRGVNLLSPWVLEEIRVRALRKRFAYALAALLVLVGGAYTLQELRLSGARAELRGEVAVGDSLRARIDDLAPVASYVGGVAQRAETVHDTMATQISQAGTLQALQRATPVGATLDSVSFLLPVPGVPAEAAAGEVAPVAPSAEHLAATRGIITRCPGPDPFATRQVVACVQLTGSAPDRRTVSALVRALAADRLFVEPFVDATTTAEGRVAFTGSVGLSPAAFTGRYDDVVPAEGAE